MRLNTMITLGASVACAGLAVVLARGWIHDAVTSQSQPSSFISAPAPDLAVTPVLVADTELRFGDTVSRDTLTLVDYPEGSVPQGAMEDYSDLFSEPGARIVALTRINAGEPVLDFKVSLPGSRATLAHIIQPGMRAKAIRVSDAESVAGFVLPGDRVDVLYIRDEEGDTRYGLDMRSDVLLQGVRVLAVDQMLDTQMDGAVVGATVTLEISIEEVQRLALAEETGTLSLALRAVGEEAMESTATLHRGDLLGAAPAASAPQVWRPRRATPKARAKSNTATVVVHRGETRDEVSVVSEPAPSTSELAGGTL